MFGQPHIERKLTGRLARSAGITACVMILVGLGWARTVEAASEAAEDPPPADAPAADASDAATDAADADPAQTPDAAEVDPERIAALVEQLGAPSYEVREEATEALRRIGLPAKAAIVKALKSEDAEVRFRAQIVRQSIRARELRRGAGPEDRELHIVGCYQGAYPPGVGHGGGKHPTGSATVRVDRPGRAVTLVLCAYEPVQWTIEPSESTFIERVILSGYHDQSLAERPEVAKVEKSSSKAGDRIYFFAYKQGDKRYREMIEKLAEITDLPTATFQGTYALTDPVTVDTSPTPTGKQDPTPR